MAVHNFDRVKSVIRTFKESAGFKMFATELVFLKDDEKGPEVVATVQSHSEEYLAFKQSEYMFELLEEH